MTREASHTTEAITIDDMENSSSLNYASLFKTLKDILDNEIIPVLEAQFTVIQNMFIQEMESLMSKRILIMFNI